MLYDWKIKELLKGQSLKEWFKNGGILSALAFALYAVFGLECQVPQAEPRAVAQIETEAVPTGQPCIYEVRVWGEVDVAQEWPVLGPQGTPDGYTVIGLVPWKVDKAVKVSGEFEDILAVYEAAKVSLPPPGERTITSNWHSGPNFNVARFQCKQRPKPDLPTRDEE